MLGKGGLSFRKGKVTVGGSAFAAAIKRRQMLIAAGLILAALAAMFGLFHMMRQAGQKPAAPATEKPRTLSIAPPGGAVDPKDAWRGQEGARIDRLEKSVAELTEAIKRQDRPAGPGTPPFPPDRPPVQPVSLPPPPPPAPPPAITPAQIGGAPGSRTLGAAQPQPQPQEETAEIESGRMPDQPAPKDEAVTTRQKAARSASTYLPSGSFVRAVILSGLLAPTGGQAQSNPHPVLLRLVDHAQLPNRFRMQAKDCLIVGSGWGDLSSERAYIRTETLSCIKPSGEALDIKIKGYVAGEDGASGVRGRLVTKQGQVLANALIAGIGSGLGQSFQQSASTVSTSPLGSTMTVKEGKELQAGIYGGVGKALDRLAQYYISLAEKLYPVIEVNAGRIVDVVITQGADLPLGEDEEAAPAGGRYGLRNP